MDSIKQWYMATYPSDDLGKEIDDCATFTGLFENMDRRKDVYTYIGVHDSIVRERVFEKLADVMGVTYDYVYDQWMICE